MIRQINIERFKSIQSAELCLEKINVLVGANNSGKSSILQALQFVTSVAQASKLYAKTHVTFKNDKWSTTIAPAQLIYSPVKDPFTLGAGGNLSQNIDRSISISFVDDQEHVVIGKISRGKNKNINAAFTGEYLGLQLTAMDKPFCMYVPGLAGITFEEEIRPVGIVNKIAAKGDSNTVFRNVLYRLHEDVTKWESFITNLKELFPDIRIRVDAKPETDGYIDVEFTLDESSSYLPIDLAGTGVLQAIQITAYVNYFQPSLLLLDEPDSHLHPSNQRLLADLLVALTRENETTILISTHSRHLMSALHNDAKFFLVRNGTVSDEKFDYFSWLLELGALDEYDRIKNGALRYIVLTEDSTRDSKKYLTQVLMASGFGPDEFKIYSYQSVSSVNSAKLFASFLADLNPNLTVIIYRDRDGLYDKEIEKIKKDVEKTEQEVQGHVKFVVAHFNDIEMYYCNAKHLVEICNAKKLSLSEEDADALIENAIQTVDDDSKQKFYGHRGSLAKRKDDGAWVVEAEKEYSANKTTFAYGKKVAGQVTRLLQDKYKQNVDIYQKTAHIADAQFISIHSDMESADTSTKNLVASTTA